MKPFDLEAAKRGEPIVTRNGRPAKFVAHVPESKYEKVITLIDGGIYMFYENGSYHRNFEHPVDLFMAQSPMRSINGHEYPEPVREPLEKDQEYCLVDPTEHTGIFYGNWDGEEREIRWLERGLIQLTREAAEAHARAIILAGGGEV